MRTTLAALLAALVITASPATANPEPVNIPAHTHFQRAGDLVDPYYIGRVFKWHQPGCRYRDCTWYRITSVAHYDHGPFIPEYDGGPRVWIQMTYPDGTFSGEGGVVLGDHTRVLVRGAA